MKKFLKFSSLLLGFSLIAGGLAVGGHKASKETKAEDESVVVSIAPADVPDGYVKDQGTSGSFTKTVLTTDDLSISYEGINTKSGVDAKDHSYGYLMFLKNYGFAYSTTAIEDYYVSNVTVAFTAQSSTNGKVGINFATSALNTRNSDVSGAVVKGGSYSLNNNDKTKTYWNFSTTGANVQITSMSVTYKSVNAGDVDLDSISVANITINPGQKADAVVEFNPEDATNQKVAFEITEGNDVATVDEKGVVTGLKAGSAVLKVTPDDENASAVTANITVEDYPEVESIETGKEYVIKSVIDETTYKLGSYNEKDKLFLACGDSEEPAHVAVLDGVYVNTVAFKVNDSYLSYSGTSNNILLSEEVSSESSWTVSTETVGDVDELVVRNVANRARVFSFNYNSGNCRFACYANTNQKMVSFEEIKQDVVLTSIDITSSLSVKVGLTSKIEVTYTPADAYDRALSWESDDETIATVDKKGVVTGVSAGKCTITASKDGFIESKTCTVTVVEPEKINFEIVDTASKLVDGAQYIVVGINKEGENDVMGHFQSGSSNIKPVSTGFIAAPGEGSAIKELVEPCLYTVTKGEDGYWSFFDGNKYLYAAGGNNSSYNYLKVEDKITDEAKFEITFNEGNILVVAQGDVVNNCLRYNISNALFSCYGYNGDSSPKQSQIYLYRAISGEGTAEAFVESFMSKTSKICSATGDHTEALEGIWDELKEGFESLAGDEKAKFLAETPSALISSMLERYDYIVAKYSLENFIDGHEVAPLNNVYRPLSTNNDNAIVIIAVVSVVSITTLAVLIVVKRRKAINK